MVSSISTQFWAVEILFTFSACHSSQAGEIYGYYQGVPFLLEASEISWDIPYIFKEDIDKLKYIQKKVTRIVKCLKTCQVRNVSVILCSKKWWCWVWKMLQHPCRAMITSFNYLKSSHVKLGFYIFWIVPEGEFGPIRDNTRRLTSTVYKHTYSIVRVIVSALLLIPMELHCYPHTEWDIAWMAWVIYDLKIKWSFVTKLYPNGWQFLFTSLMWRAFRKGHAIKSPCWHWNPRLMVHAVVQCSFVSWGGSLPPYLLTRIQSFSYSNETI